MALAIELASTLCRAQEQALVVGPVAPSELEPMGLSARQSAEHHDGDDDLDAWAAANTRPGDLVIVPIHDSAIGAAAIRLHRSERSVLAVSQNPESSLGT